MAYSDAALVRIKWGQANVDKWADLNNNGNNAEIEARIVDAIDEADLIIDQHLRGGGYDVPFVIIPEEIRHASAKLAGYILYEPRRMDDLDDEGNPKMSSVSGTYTRIIKWLKSVRAGVIKLSVGNPASSLPDVIPAGSSFNTTIVPPASEWILDSEVTTVIFS